MPQSSSLTLVSCEEGCCPNTRRVEDALEQFQTHATRVRLRTLAGLAMRLCGKGDALFNGEGAGTPVLFVTDDETGERIWTGENPSELEILQALYLAGNFA